MELTRAGIALIGVALTLSIHGCALDSLKPSVQIAIGKKCDEQASAIKDSDGLDDLKKENIKACDELDEDKLTSFGVEDCPAILHSLISTAMEMECMGAVAEASLEACDEVDADCKTAVDDAAKDWKPEEPPIDPEEENAETEGGEEAVLYLLQSCEKTAEDRAKDAEDIAAACDTTSEHGPNADFMKVMDVSADDCAEQAASTWVLAHSAMCLTYVMTHPDAPDDPKEVTKEDIDTALEEFWAAMDSSMEELEESMDEPAERLRLYQSTIKSKKWSRKAATPVGKILILGGASGVAMMALFVVVRRHRAQQSVPVDEEMLMSDE